MGRRRRNKLTHLDLCFSNFMGSFIHDHHHQSHQSPNNNNLPPPSHHNRPSSSSSSSTSIIKNFNTLYDTTTTEPQPQPQPQPQPPDFATAFASQRFFFSSPGRSNSILESTPSSSSSSSLTSSLTTTTLREASPASAAGEETNNNKAVLFEGSVAVPTYSPNPYLDFRQSMEEMVEARPEVMADVKSNWHVLQELLMCYLALNPKSTHKFILGAFADVVVTRMASSASSSSLSSSCCPAVHGGDGDGGSGEC